MRSLNGHHVVATVLVLFGLRSQIASILNWKSLEGFEAYWIAQSIAIGEGYSFPSNHRWLFEPSADGIYHLTAWVDPIYTYILGSMIWLFGEHHQLAAAIFNAVCYVAVAVALYHLAERTITPSAGVWSLLLLALSEFSASTGYMNNTMLAAALIMVTALLLVVYLERPSHVRAVHLGAILGVTVLACPSAQLFIPVACASAVAFGWRSKGPALRHAALILVISALTISPWTLRNYNVFGEVVPVRNGVGQITFVGVVAAGAAVSPEIIESNVKPSWTAASPLTAVLDTYRDPAKLRALEEFQLAYAQEIGPPGWPSMNEAQRDAWFVDQTKALLLSEPLLSTNLAAGKALVFVGAMGWIGALVALLAALGFLANLKNPAVLTMGLWAGAYAAPFLIIVCYYSRYRAPIEPLLTVLATVGLAWLMRNIAATWPGIDSFIMSIRKSARSIR